MLFREERFEAAAPAAASNTIIIKQLKCESGFQLFAKQNGTSDKRRRAGCDVIAVILSYDTATNDDRSTDEKPGVWRGNLMF